ncbi:hypothetical protein [uncultured Pseudokineococcus sp.]|uniref:hypothetical protein n=1 Tax=uncultured Pseudokineococcus sp. TaxID=1642928 RepID=UPI0026252654|nr:hypothetical protein [uncultured Pseudokineococcus sp.]
MSTPDDSTRRPVAGDPDLSAHGAAPADGPATTTDLDRDDDVLLVEEDRRRERGGSAGPGLALSGLLTGLLALFLAGTESAVRECTPDPVGVTASGVDGYLTALLLAVVAVVLSAVGVALSREARWGASVGVAGVVVGVLVVVVWLLSVWLLAADPVDLATVTSQEATFPLQGVGCA